MGWISARKMMTGTSLNTNKGKKISEKGPLRKVVCVINPSDSIFSGDYAELECGHTQYGFGQYRMRCVTCKKEEVL